MSIKSLGGVFGRNPTFNNVTVEGDISIDGTLSVNGNVLSGLDFEGAWDATSGAPSATPSTGQFWIVSVAGTTNLSGITNWGIGDWALYDGSAWQRIEGGANGNFKELTSSSTTVLNGTTIPASKTLLVTTDIGSTVEAYDATILKSADIGSTVQGYDATILTSSDIGSTVQGYDATILTSSDIGSTVQAYDADTAKLDVNQTWTGTQAFNGAVVINEAGADVDFRIEGNTNSNLFVVNAGTDRIGVNNPNPGAQFEVRATHTETDVTTADSNSTLAVANDGTGNGVYNAIRLAGNQQDMYIMSFNNSAQASRRLGFFVGSVAGDAVADERLSILGGGDVKVNNGNLVIGTSGKGIDFSATSGTGTSELFDDYEEGTWSGAITDGTTDKTFTGYYTKIGNTVYIKGGKENIQQSGTALSGTIYVTGLPYSVTSSAVIALRQNYMSTTTIFQGVASSTTIRFYNQSSASSDNVQMSAGNINTYTDLSFSGVYHTS